MRATFSKVRVLLATIVTAVLVFMLWLHFHERLGYQSRMKLVVQQAILKSGDAQEESDLAAGRVFVDISGLGLGQHIVGVSIPRRGRENAVMVSFTAEHFQNTAVPKLVDEMLLDLRTARNTEQKN